MTAMTCPEDEALDLQGPVSTWIKAAEDRVLFVVKPARPDSTLQVDAADPRARVAEPPSSRRVRRPAALPAA